MSLHLNFFLKNQRPVLLITDEMFLDLHSIDCETHVKTHGCLVILKHLQANLFYLIYLIDSTCPHTCNLI
jgi:hypothetical protein